MAHKNLRARITIEYIAEDGLQRVVYLAKQGTMLSTTYDRDEQGQQHILTFHSEARSFVTIPTSDGKLVRADQLSDDVQGIVGLGRKWQIPADDPFYQIKRDVVTEYIAKVPATPPVKRTRKETK